MNWSDELVTVDRFMIVSEAQLALATLEAAGIDAVLIDENVTQLNWGEASAHGGVRLQVRRRDAETAAEILRGTVDLEERAHVERGSYAPPEPGGDGCRRCGSEEIYPAVARSKSFARAIVVSIAGPFCLFMFHGFVGLPPQVLSVLYLALVAAPLVTWLAAGVAPRMRCRNCQAEWRGQQRTV